MPVCAIWMTSLITQGSIDSYSVRSRGSGTNNFPPTTAVHHFLFLHCLFAACEKFS